MSFARSLWTAVGLVSPANSTRLHVISQLCCFADHSLCIACVYQEIVKRSGPINVVSEICLPVRLTSPEYGRVLGEKMWLTASCGTVVLRPTEDAL